MLFNFNAHNIEYEENPNLTNGIYNVKIIKTELVKSKQSDAKMIKLLTKITSENCKGALIDTMIIYEMPSSETAERIGKQKLGKILFYIGRPEINDTDQMIGGEFQVKINMRVGTSRAFPDVVAIFEKDTHECKAEKAGSESTNNSASTTQSDNKGLSNTSGVQNTSGSTSAKKTNLWN